MIQTIPAIVEMVMAIEEEFGLELPDSFFHPELTMLDVVSKLNATTDT